MNLTKISQYLAETLGGNLVSVVVFGSIARSLYRDDSDIDVLVVTEKPVNVDLRQVSSEMSREISPVFKTCSQIESGYILCVEMVDASIILYDRDNFIQNHLALIGERLIMIGAQRINGHWLLKEVSPLSP